MEVELIRPFCGKKLAHLHFACNPCNRALALSKGSVSSTRFRDCETNAKRADADRITPARTKSAMSKIVLRTKRPHDNMLKSDATEIDLFTLR